jgi:hypothetical protein
MSNAQKVRMSLAAAAKTPRQYELHVRKLLAFADCPCVSVFASSGGPSTECSFTCEFDTGLPGWSPDCPTLGRRKGCKALSRMFTREPRDYKRLLALRMMQVHFADYTPQTSGAVGWFAVVQGAN